MSFDVTTVPLPRHHLSRRAVIIPHTPPRASSRRRNRRRRRCRSHRRRRRRLKTRARQSIKSINQSARPFTVSEKTRLGNGDDADDDDDSKRHFCVYVFVCVYSMNLYTYRYVCGTDRDGPGRTRGAAERDGRRRRRDRARDDGLRKIHRRYGSKRGVGAHDFDVCVDG